MEFVVSEGRTNDESSFVVSEYAGWDIFGTIELLLFNLSTDTNLIVVVISHVVSLIDREFKGARFRTQESEAANRPKELAELQRLKFVECVKKSLGGILIGFGERLSGGLPYFYKLTTLRSLQVLITLVKGSLLINSRMRFMRTLTLSAESGPQGPEFKAILCETWDVFIRDLDQEFVNTDFGMILTTVLPLAARARADAAPVLEKLMKLRDDSLRPYRFAIDLSKYRPLFRNTKSLDAREFANVSFTEQLDLCYQLISQENSGVKLLGLEKLEVILCDSGPELTSMLQTTDRIPRIISDLINILLLSLRCQVRCLSLIFNSGYLVVHISFVMLCFIFSLSDCLLT